MEPDEAIRRMRRAVAIGGYMDAEETEDCTRAVLALIDSRVTAQVTEEMVERGALALARELAEEWVFEEPDAENLTTRVAYRESAAAVLSAALNQEES